MNDLTTGYAIAAFSLLVNLLTEEIRQGRITSHDAQEVITRSRSLVSSLDAFGQGAQTAGDKLLASVSQALSQVSPLSTGSGQVA